MRQGLSGGKSLLGNLKERSVNKKYCWKCWKGTRYHDDWKIQVIWKGVCLDHRMSILRQDISRGRHIFFYIYMSKDMILTVRIE